MVLLVTATAYSTTEELTDLVGNPIIAAAARDSPGTAEWPETTEATADNQSQQALL
jgi:hypothetical protein